MAPGGQNVVGVLGLLLVQLAKKSLSQNLRKPNNSIERCAQLVRNVGEELRLVAVGGFKLPALVFDLAKQPRILNRQGGLRGECLQWVDNFRRKTAHLFSPDRQS